MGFAGIKALVILAAGMSLAAQCSDTGICGLERLPSGENHAWELAYLDGRSGDPDALHFQTLRLEGSFSLEDSSTLLISLPFLRISGPLGKQTGVGDLSVVVDRPLWKTAAATWSLQVGGRFGTGKTDGDPALPQAYQTGLGGTDLLLGLRLAGTAWQGGVGYQVAGKRNNNSITRLKRGDDLLAWVEFGGRVGVGNVAVKANAIKRLQRSSVRNAADETFMELADSDFTQANLAGTYSWVFAKTWDLELGVTLPLLSRKTNEDGSKRTLTSFLGVRQRF